MACSFVRSEVAGDTLAILLVELLAYYRKLCYKINGRLECEWRKKRESLHHHHQNHRRYVKFYTLSRSAFAALVSTAYRSECVHSSQSSTPDGDSLCLANNQSFTGYRSSITPPPLQSTPLHSVRLPGQTHKAHTHTHQNPKPKTK